MKAAGESLEKGDLQGAQKALQGAGDALDKLAKATDGFSSLDKAGRGLQRSLEELVGEGTAGDGEKSGAGAGSKSGDGKGGVEAGKDGAGKPGDGKPGDGKPGDGKPGAGKPGDGKPGAGSKIGAGKAGAGAGKSGSGAGKAGAEGAGPIADPGGLIRDEGPADGDAVQVQDLGGFRADFRPDGRRGGRPVSDLPPFAVRDPADRDDAVYLYEEKVGDYLSRENVPAEYREIIKKYFGLPEGDESTRSSGDGR